MAKQIRFESRSAQSLHRCRRCCVQANNFLQSFAALFGPHSSTVVSVYRKTESDTAQTFLPPVQAVADVIPGVGGIIKGAIVGITCVLQLVDGQFNFIPALVLILKPEVQKKLEGDG